MGSDYRDNPPWLTMSPSIFLGVGLIVAPSACFAADQARLIGQEHALPRHLADGEEFPMSSQALIAWGARIFQANWTIQDGAGRNIALL